MPDIDFIRAEIERMRRQIGRQRRKSNASSVPAFLPPPAEALRERMLRKVDGLAAERDRLKGKERLRPAGLRLGQAH